jgi:hypothetical protein
MQDNPRKLYIDTRESRPSIKVDDFIVAIGKKKSNSVYHISEARHKINAGFVRNSIVAYKTELYIALMRNKDQQLVPVKWYK